MLFFRRFYRRNFLKYIDRRFFLFPQGIKFLRIFSLNWNRNRSFSIQLQSLIHFYIIFSKNFFRGSNNSIKNWFYSIFLNYFFKIIFITLLILFLHMCYHFFQVFISILYTHLIINKFFYIYYVIFLNCYLLSIYFIRQIIKIFLNTFITLIIIFYHFLPKIFIFRNNHIVLINKHFDCIFTWFLFIFYVY